MMLKRKNIRTKNAAAAVNIIMTSMSMTNTIMTSMITTTAAADTTMLSMTMTSMDIHTVTDAPAAHTETMTKRKKAST